MLLAYRYSVYIVYCNPQGSMLIDTVYSSQGYEWNKYNQTHYDTDNPPPKVVQGYKFNVS